MALAVSDCPQQLFGQDISRSHMWSPFVFQISSVSKSRSCRLLTRGSGEPFLKAMEIVVLVRVVVVARSEGVSESSSEAIYIISLDQFGPYSSGIGGVSPMRSMIQPRSSVSPSSHRGRDMFSSELAGRTRSGEAFTMVFQKESQIVFGASTSTTWAGPR